MFLLQPIANEDEEAALELIRHPRSVVTFSDAGAHVSQIMDNSLQTHLLSYWVREKQALTLEGGDRPAGGRQALEADRRGHPRHRGEWRGAAAREPAHRRGPGAAAALRPARLRAGGHAIGGTAGLTPWRRRDRP